MSQVVSPAHNLCKENVAASSETLISRPDARRQAGGISRSTEQRLISDDPDWPTPVPISPGKSGYVQREITEWIALKIAWRTSGAIGLSSGEREILKTCLEAPWELIRREWPFLRKLRNQAEPLSAPDRARLIHLHGSLASNQE